MSLDTIWFFSGICALGIIKKLLKKSKILWTVWSRICLFSLPIPYDCGSSLFSIVKEGHWFMNGGLCWLPWIVAADKVWNHWHKLWYQIWYDRALWMVQWKGTYFSGLSYFWIEYYYWFVNVELCWLFMIVAVDYVSIYWHYQIQHDCGSSLFSIGERRPMV